MLKKWIFCAFLIAIITFISSGFNPIKPSNHLWFFNPQQVDSYSLPSQNKSDYLTYNTPFTGKYFIGFKEALAFKESQGHYNRVNSLGYMGKYQFGSETLKSIGIQNHSNFMVNPKLQEKAFIALLKRNKYELQDEIRFYSGKIISGVKITESGILAAAHLGGVNSVKKFLNTNGNRKCKDENGASIKTYMRDFGGFETTGIIADSNARTK